MNPDLPYSADESCLKAEFSKFGQIAEGFCVNAFLVYRISLDFALHLMFVCVCLQLSLSRTKLQISRKDMRIYNTRRKRKPCLL